MAVTDTSGTVTKYGYDVYVPIDSTEEGSVKYAVNALDADHTVTQTFSFNIDNTAPTLDSDSIKGNNDILKDDAEVTNNNYIYTLSGASLDSGSGFERAVFYFMRKSGTTKKNIGTEVLLDPMITTGTADAKIAMSDLEEVTVTQKVKEGTNSYTLYAYERSGSATLSVFTASAALNEHIRVGGLIYIDGVFRRITAKSGNAVTFEPALAAASTGITAKFPVGQVIDNLSSETVTDFSANPFNITKGDDGDLMPESIAKAGTTWNWDASIHSDNMPDGPATLVILAFDKAGNVAGTSYNVTIANNAPRVAKLYLATDLNKNGKFAANEFEVYSLIGKTGAAQERYTIDLAGDDFSEASGFGAGVFTVKDKLAVVPELTGGNGSVKLVVKKDATTADPVTSDAPIASEATGTAVVDDATAEKPTYSATLSPATTVTAPSFAASAKGNKFFAYVLSNEVVAGTSGTLTESMDGEGKAFSFTFWDSTEETTCGTDSQNAAVLVKNFTFDLVDSEKPKTVINPFYWNDASDNSLYENSAKNGHIELEADLTTGLKASPFGKGPKVSGKVTFTGTAYDEHALKSLSFSFAGFKSGSTLSMATHEPSAEKWTPATATMATDGYEVTITEDESTGNGNFADSVYFGQKGHKVYWTLSINTELITNFAVKDNKLTVTATDLANNSTDTSLAAVKPDTSTGSYIVTDGTTFVPTYTVDVVPYVVGVKTALSSLKKANSRAWKKPYTCTALTLLAAN